MNDSMPWVYGALAFIGVFVLLRFAVRKIGCSCHGCGGRMHFWNELQPDEQRDILAYFREVEQRTPDTTSVFVCPKCNLVYDDFSGERLSLDGDNASFCKICRTPHVNYLGQYAPIFDLSLFHERNTHLLDKTECLSCRRKPLGVGDCIRCDTPFKVMGCRHCKTLYAWLPMMEKKFLYTVPLTAKRVIPNGPTWLPL